MRALPPEVWHHVLAYVSSFRDQCAMRRCVSSLLDKTYCRSCRSDVACMFHERDKYVPTKMLRIQDGRVGIFYTTWNQCYYPRLIHSLEVRSNVPLKVSIWIDVTPETSWTKCRRQREAGHDELFDIERTYLLTAKHRPPDIVVDVDPRHSSVRIPGFPRWCRRGMRIVSTPIPITLFGGFLEDVQYNIDEETYRWPSSCIMR